MNWNYLLDNWTLISVSDDSQKVYQGGGTLHIYRPIDLVYK